MTLDPVLSKGRPQDGIRVVQWGLTGKPGNRYHIYPQNLKRYPLVGRESSTGGRRGPRVFRTEKVHGYFYLSPSTTVWSFPGGVTGTT